MVQLPKVEDIYEQILTRPELPNELVEKPLGKVRGVKIGGS
jgi:hypothetical protein